MRALSILLAYGLGSLPFALLVARWRGTPDLRREGSGNLGATNVARVAGAGAGVLVALLDIGKGAAGVLMAERLTGADVTTAAAAGLAAVVGHIFPIGLRFRGGKGVATACGAFAVLAPLALVAAVVVFLAGAVLTRYVSVGSLAAALTLPIAAYATGVPTPVELAAIATSLLVIARHRSNAARLWSGTERRLGARA